MKDRPGLRQVVSILLKALVQQFMKITNPQACDFDPIYAEATFLDPRYKQAATCGVLHQVCLDCCLNSVN